MKIKRFLVLFIAVMLCGALAAIGGEARYFIPGGSQRTTNSDYVVPVIQNAGTGYLTPATFTFSIPQHTAVRVPTLATGTKRFRVYVYANGANYGPSSVASGVSYLVATATLTDFMTVATTTPRVYFIGLSAAATGTLLCE